MSAKHTPGPWFHGLALTNGQACIVGDGDGDTVACLMPDGTTGCMLNEANASLNEAAPELLAALKIAVRQNSHDMLMTDDELRICETAIAKATGEQP